MCDRNLSGIDGKAGGGIAFKNGRLYGLYP